MTIQHTWHKVFQPLHSWSGFRGIFTGVLLSSLSFTIQAQSLENRLEHMVDSVYKANPEALGILIHVESPDRNISWSYATGYSDTSRRLELGAQQPVLIASNTKSYVSAAILRLVEKGSIALEDSIPNLLNESTRLLLEGNGYNLGRITIRHLLSHTSGIFDYVDDGYFDFVLANPQHQWSRSEQIKRTVDIGDPLGKPGVEFSYGDINYLLLTEIIETKTEKPFFIAIRDLLDYQGLGLTNTWFKDLEPTPLNSLPFAHQYADSFRWDSYNLNPSWDLYGGGGIATTAKEAALFYQYLFERKIVKNKRILREMSTYVLPEETSKYCLGLYHFDFDFNLYYHGGWWGTDVNYSPETNSSVAVFTLVKDVRGEVNPFLGKEIQKLLH